MTIETAAIRTEFAHLFVGGEFVQPLDGSIVESVNPATGKVWATVAMGGVKDIDAAVAAARHSFCSGPWRKYSGSQRSRLLEDLARRIETDAEALAEIDSTDNGKPIALCRGDAANAALWFRYFAGLADKLNGERLALSSTDWAYTVPEPLGVVAAIIPWNSPVLLAAWKLAPALAAGNTVVLKPSEHASASCLRLAALIRDAGFPSGVVNVVPGLGHIAGEALAAHPDVAKISFTGSDATAKRIGSVAAQAFKSVTMECGGKAPLIVFADADPSDAAAKAVGGMFVNAGQQCTVAARVLVERRIHEDFRREYLRQVEQLGFGDPADPKNIAGAIVSAGQRDRVNRYLDIATSEGGRFLVGGPGYVPRDPRLKDGYWVQPTVIEGIGQTSQVCQDEIFGPVAMLQAFDDEDEAIEMANATRYGLTSGVFTNDIRRAHRVAARIEAGIVWINTYRRLGPGLPYGGVKSSGIGREGGSDALRAYTKIKSIIVDA